MKSKFLILIISSFLLLYMAGFASANLITNGTFDTDLSSWTLLGNNQWDSGWAHIGRPGPDGVSSINQEFALAGNNLHVSFDYIFFGGSSAPAGDVFTANFYGATTSGGPYTLTHALINETYPGGANTTLVQFDAMLTIPVAYSYALILFELDETPSTARVGTRVELDNVVVETAPIPEPATMLLLGTGLVGVAGAARRRKKNQA
jgi:hypothetical protein